MDKTVGGNIRKDIRKGGRTQIHLLVVEDNAINRKVAEKMLNRRGYKVSLAPNGKEALAAIQDTEFDAVLMDCNMPVMDGYAATAALQEQHTQYAARVARIQAAIAFHGGEAPSSVAPSSQSSSPSH